MSKYFIGVEIEINHHCNLACEYCPNATTERNSKGIMNEDKFIIILNQLADINFEGKISYHFYNEPLLHPDLEKFVALSKKILPKTRSEIYTNGMFLNEEKYYNLRKAGVDKFTVTHHKGIKNFVFDGTYKNLPEEEKNRVKYINHSQLVYTNRGNLVGYGKKITAPLTRTCLIPSCSLVITVDGNIVACYEDYKEKHVMGNIFQEHIKEIWNRKEYSEFRYDLKKGHRYKYEVCKTCNNFQVIL